jgi:uncharacterized repeat protein (TIGR01451 family)
VGFRRAALFATAVAGAGLTALAIAQSPPATVSPAAAVPVAPRPTFFQPVDQGTVVPPAPPRGSGPVVAGPNGIVPGSIELPPPTVPTVSEPVPLVVPVPTIPVTSPSTLPPSVTPAPQATVEVKPDVAAEIVPPATTAAPDFGPKPFGASAAAAQAVGPVGGLPAKQTPTVGLETVAPDAVTAGADFTYELVVRNDGSATVWGVRVEDDLPPGAKLVVADPAPEVTGTKLYWIVGTLEPTGTRKIRITLRPADEGEVRTRATVTFATTTEARVKVTRPKLAVELAGGATARAGEPTTVQIKLTNSGTGPANNLVLRANLSDGLTHTGGQVLELKLPALPAGQTKTIPLKVTAAKGGAQACGVTVTADGAKPESARYAVAVVEPKLTARTTGPAKCLVKGEPVYLMELTNPGSAGTDPVAVTATVPVGFEFGQASDGGSFNPTTREVAWRLGGLEPGKGKAVSLKLKAVAPCDATLKTVARTVPAGEPIGDGIQPAGAVGRGLEVKAETPIKAEGMPGLRFEVADLEDPVEVGKEAMYEIKVVNQGTGPCTNVVVVATPAEGTTATAATGPTTARAQGAVVNFDPVTKLDVKGEVVFRVRVKATEAGDHKFKVQVSSTEIKTPITKEENTRFYKE